MKQEITARRLQEAMYDIGISSRELSQRSGVSEASVSQYVNGKNAPHNLNSKRMADVLGVNPVWLMGYDVPKYVNQTETIFVTKQEQALVEAYRKLQDNQKALINQMLNIREEQP